MRHLKGTSTLFCIILVFYLHGAEFKDCLLVQKNDIIAQLHYAIMHCMLNQRFAF